MSPQVYTICSNSRIIGLFSVNKCPACCQARAGNAPVPDTVAGCSGALVAEAGCRSAHFASSTVLTLAWQRHTPSTAVPLIVRASPTFAPKPCADALPRNRCGQRVLSHRDGKSERALLPTSTPEFKYTLN